MAAPVRLVFALISSLLLIVEIRSDTKGCKQFNSDDFGENSPSIFYGESQGRLGNQLLGYAMLIQLQRQLGVQSYVSQEMRDLLQVTFTPDSLELPVLSETFCNPAEIPWQIYRGHLSDLLTNETHRTGKLMWLYKPYDEDHMKGGYRYSFTLQKRP